MAKSLFQKGADFVTAMVFMFASTNLVVELGIVLVILMGWQFAAAEFIGGPIMIVLLAVLGGIGALASIDRSGPDGDSPARRWSAGMITMPWSASATSAKPSSRREPWRQKLTSPAAWADAASYTMADLKMLRRELVFGYVVAGFLTVLVPIHFWHSVFISGHGFWTSAENAVVGPFIAVISFVCSIGNVPLAAALWVGGISFGGVIAFIFADLITFPLLLIYRKYYGTRLTLAPPRRVLGGDERGRADRRRPLRGTRARSPSLDPHQHRRHPLPVELHDLLEHRLPRRASPCSTGCTGTGTPRRRPGYAIDPVCGMQVQHRQRAGSDNPPGRTTTGSVRTIAPNASPPIPTVTWSRPGDHAASCASRDRLRPRGGRSRASGTCGPPD